MSFCLSCVISLADLHFDFCDDGASFGCLPQSPWIIVNGKVRLMVRLRLRWVPVPGTLSPWCLWHIFARFVCSRSVHMHGSLPKVLGGNPLVLFVFEASPERRKDAHRFVDHVWWLPPLQTWAVVLVKSMPSCIPAKSKM